MRQMPIFMLAFLAAMAGPAFADSRDDVLLGLSRCGALADPRAWLDCYYGAAQPMRAQLGLSPAPQAQTVLAPGYVYAPPLQQAAPQSAVAPQPRQKSRGFFADLLGGAVLISRAHVSAYSFDANGIFTITLSDGQVWQQLPNDDAYAKWHEAASHYVVTIKQGSLGSSNLQVAGDNKVYKVRPVH